MADSQNINVESANGATVQIPVARLASSVFEKVLLTLIFGIFSGLAGFGVMVYDMKSTQMTIQSAQTVIQETQTAILEEMQERSNWMTRMEGTDRQLAHNQALLICAETKRQGGKCSVMNPVLVD